MSRDFPESDMTIVSLNLLTPEELATFSPATQQSIASLLDIRRS